MDEPADGAAGAVDAGGAAGAAGAAGTGGKDGALVDEGGAGGASPASVCVAADCSSGVCAADGTCADATCRDGVRNGAEVGVDCGGPVCDPCALTCAAGHADCDGDPTTGCEANVLTSAVNCGMCGHACTLVNAESICVNGECRIGACRGSFQNCGTSDADGCRTNIDTDPRNCGGCGIECSTVNGAARCAAGQCEIACAAGFADCDGNPSNGCETSADAVQTDLQNCGRCGHVCEAAHATTQCIQGGCVLEACAAGWGDCDGQSDDGCETSLTSANNCGACGDVCPAAAPTCVNVAGSNRCQATVSYVNDARGTAFDTTLTFDHTLVAGTARLLLLAVAVEATNDAGYNDVRPTAVKYGDVTMAPSGSQTSGPTTAAYSPYLFYYYLPEAALPSSGQTLTITVPPNSVDLITAELIEFSGVDQVTPVVIGTGAAFDIASGPCSATGDITTMEPGTALFVASASHLAGPASVVGSELVTPPIWNQGLTGANGFRIYGALGGTDGTMIAPGTHTVGFSSDGCSPAAVLPIGIVPYHQ